MGKQGGPVDPTPRRESGGINPLRLNRGPERRPEATYPLEE